MSHSILKFWKWVLGSVMLFCAPLVASAHEVYVLPHDTVATAMATPRFSELAVIYANMGQFIFWACITATIILVIFATSISHKIEKWGDPFLARLPRYAPVISRVTIGISFIAAAYYQALFGPELPFTTAFFGHESFITALLIVIGGMITLGWYARIAAFIGLCLFGIEILQNGVYMLTYSNYLGELVLLMILGAHHLGFHTRHHDAVRFPKWLLDLKMKLVPFSFLILRVAFGVGLLYSSLYAKIIHNNLALNVAYANPSLIHFFGFEPHFLVLGAALVEILIALFFILGIEIRFTSLFLLFWLSLSLWYFGEAVWPHIVLFGIPIAFICYGYDKYSLEGFLFKRNGREPVL